MKYIAKMPAAEVYMMLLYDFESFEYQKRYAEVMKAASKTK